MPGHASPVRKSKPVASAPAARERTIPLSPMVVSTLRGQPASTGGRHATSSCSAASKLAASTASEAAPSKDRWSWGAAICTDDTT
jgi:hypothetical protein